MVAPSLLGKWETPRSATTAWTSFRSPVCSADLPHRERVLLATADVVFYRRLSAFHGEIAPPSQRAFLLLRRRRGTFEKRVPPTRRSQRTLRSYHDRSSATSASSTSVSITSHREARGRFSEGSVVMVGPFVKVDPDAYRSGPNIHWLGQRDYQQLPAYVKGFDVCLIAVRSQCATENIIRPRRLKHGRRQARLSTAVRDVVRNFAPVVQLRHAEQSTDLVERAYRAPQADALARGIERANARHGTPSCRDSRAYASAVRANEPTPHRSP